MGLIRRKLHSGRGASILLALVFFLVCGFVGAVILGSATANAQKVRDRRADRQAYYAVSSAARLLRDTLGDSACKGWEDQVTYGCHNDSHSEAGSHRCEKTEFMGTSGGNLLTEAAWKVFCSQTRYYLAEKPAPPYETAFTVEAGEGIPDVEAVLTIDQSYNVTIQLWAGAEKRHPMSLRLAASVQQTDEEIQRPECHHEAGTNEAGETIWNYYTGNTKTRTTTVSWPTAVIAKAGEEAPHG